MENKLPEIWVLVDEVAGHNAQALGVAEALGLPFSKKKLIYNKNAKLPNALKFNSLSSLDLKKSDNLTGSYPDIIISCGRKTAPIAIAIKKAARKSGKNSFACHIMWPGCFTTCGFDMVAVPSHDNLNLFQRNSKRVIRTIGSPNRITKPFLLQEYRIWDKTIGELPSPRIVLLLGGDSRKTSFTKDHAKYLVNSISSLVSNFNSSLLVTNSRRTNREVSDFVKEEFKRKIGRYYYFHDVHQSKANPFFAFLQLADAIITTGDSISMCSEAASTGKPVYIFSPDGNAPQKHRRFHDLLYKEQYATEFNNASVDKILRENNLNVFYANKTLNASSYVASEIKKRFSERA